MAGLTGDARRLLQIQCGLSVLVAASAYALTGGSDAAVAAGFGALMAMSNSWLFGRRVALATEVARTDPGRETVVLFLGALQRFVLMAAAFAVGMGALGLEPVPLLLGFAVTYGAFVLVKPGTLATPPDAPKQN